MTMAVTFSFSLVFKWPFGRKLAWICAAMTFVTLGCHRVNAWTTNNIIVYHSPKGLCMDIINDGKCYSIFDCSLTPGSIEFMTRGYRCEMDIINVDNICTEEQYNHSKFNFKNSVLSTSYNSIFLWNDTTSQESLDSNTTHILIKDCPDEVSFKEAIMCNPNVFVILPAHIDRNCRKGITYFLREHDVAFYDIDASGYYSLEL